MPKDSYTELSVFSGTLLKVWSKFKKRGRSEKVRRDRTGNGPVVTVHLGARFSLSEN